MARWVVNALQQVAFGAGTHSASARMPDLALVPDQEFPYTPNTSFRALRRLMVTW